MMKVYQPVCPDMKFRLVADLSPEAVEISEDSAVSSDSTSCTSDDEDIRVMGAHGESPASNPHHLPHSCNNPCSRLPLGSDSAMPVPNTHSTTQVCDQHPAGTEPECLMSELASASASTSVLSCVRRNDAYANGAECVDNCFHLTCRKSQMTAASIADCSMSRRDGVVRRSSPAGEEEEEEDEEQASAGGHGERFRAAADFGGASCSPQQPVCVYKKIPDRVNSSAPNGQAVNDNVCDDDDDSDDDDDNASIEDISISHNVPMCPPSPAPFSPARTPPMTRRVVMTGDREVGAVSTPSPLAERPKKVKSTGLHLDVHTKSKYQSPYTLACAITPSPLHENTSLASTLTSASGDGNTAPVSTISDMSHAHRTSGSDTYSTSAVHVSATQSPRRVPDRDTARNQQDEMSASASDAMNRSIYDEIQEALIKEVGGGGEITLEDTALTSDPDPAQQYPFIHKHMGHLFDKKRLLIGYASSGVRHRDVQTSPCRSSYSSSATRSRHVSAASTASEAATSVEENSYVSGKLEDRPTSDGEEDIIRVVCLEDEPEGAASATVIYGGQKRRRKNSDGDGSRRHSSTTMSTPYSDLEVTHRGMHRFIPRHADEVQIGIGDPIHVVKEFDDLWCEGVNLRSGERGIFPAMYANDLTFLEESEEEDEHWKFTMRFLGTVEVTSASGDMALCQAINKVAQQGRIKNASLCILEINQYGIRMIDKSKEGHESHKFSNFFALKNISFCGTHPNNNRYFAFITKHPREARFACHVFHSERSTNRARDALGKAFKRFYQEYMAFTHPTEDIWME